MNKIIEAIILAIIQGITEFLPISSSGHLEIAKAFLNNNKFGKEDMQMTVVLHAATATATIIFFRKEIVEIIKGVFTFKNCPEFQFSLKIILSMIPAVFVGLFFEKFIDSLFSQNILFVGCMLLITAILLLLADRATKTNKNVSYFSAIIIGISQAIAILPGISRSGATISISVLLGIDREKSARFSFLMVIPLILGKISKDLLDEKFTENYSDILPFCVGFVVATIVGYFACKWMIELVKKSKLIYFSGYCIIVGIIAILYSLIN